jgi:hypothetical protein
MKLYKKEGNIVQILSFPNENAEKGDYLMVEDPDVGKALIVQVIDVQFAAVPGVLEELLRTLPDGGELIQGEDIDPLEIAPHITYIQDASLLIPPKSICRLPRTNCGRPAISGTKRSARRSSSGTTLCLTASISHLGLPLPWQITRTFSSIITSTSFS